MQLQGGVGITESNEHLAPRLYVLSRNSRNKWGFVFILERLEKV